MVDLQQQVKFAAQKVAELARKLPSFGPGDGPLAIVTTRKNGFALARAWAAGNPGDGNLQQAFAQLAKGLTGKGAVEALQIELGHSARTTPPGSITPRLAAIHTGMRGIALAKGGKLLAATGPAEMIATNKPLREALDDLLAQHGLTLENIASGAAEVITFESAQILVNLVPPNLTPLYRGSALVEPKAVDRAGVTAFADRLATWLINQVDKTGRVTYEFHPSTGEEAPTDNTVRQALATLCLARIANRSKKPEDREVAERNLGYFIRHHYRTEGEFGIVSEVDLIDGADLGAGQPGAATPTPEGKEPKLGAMAILALTLLERPKVKPFEKPLAALVATTKHLQQKDGSFRTHFGVTDRDDNQNFYPGETLLLWATALRMKSPLIDAETYLKSARYYRSFFKKKPSPAFIPWHTQAHVVALESIEAPDLVKFVFEMNDWLVDLQQWQGAPYPDIAGRFYDPKRKTLGSAHASATGVYLEGLIDAYELARRSGEAARADRYRLTILRGLRNLMQLQFKSPEEMFYVNRPERVLGGIRTEVYDNRIRVDNVQHALMGTQRILARFDAAAFAWPGADRAKAPPAAKRPIKAWQAAALKRNPSK